MNTLLPIFKALSDRNRLRAFSALFDHRELCACQLIELLQVSGATASRHMGILVAAGLVTSRKEGRWVYYRRVERAAAEHDVLQWIQAGLAEDPEIRYDRAAMKKIVACDPEELCRRQRGEACCP